MKLALFDFDGTITTHDSFRDFLIFISGKSRFLLRILSVSHWLLAYALRLVSNQTAKEHVTRAFFAGMPREKFDELARAFVKQQLNKIVRPTAMKKILWHLQQKHRVIIVSASFTDYLKFWCEQHQLELISTRLEEVDGCLTGRFATPNCYGPEKVRRINEYLNQEQSDHEKINHGQSNQDQSKYEQINLSGFETIYAYGDSRGDREMLEIAHEKGYQVF